MFNQFKILISSKNATLHLKLREILRSLNFMDFFNGSLIYPQVEVHSVFDLKLEPPYFKSSEQRTTNFHLLVLELETFNPKQLQEIKIFHNDKPDLFIILASTKTTHWEKFINFFESNAKVLFLEIPFKKEVTLTLIKYICYERWLKKFFNQHLLNQLELKAEPYSHTLNKHQNKKTILNSLMFEETLKKTLSNGFIQHRNTALVCINIDNTTSLTGEAADYISGHAINDIKERLLINTPEDWCIGYWEQECFGIIIPNLSDNELCKKQLLALYDSLIEPYIIYDSEIIVSLSIGVSLSNTIITSSLQLKRQAQNAAATSSSQKRNYVTFYNPNVAQQEIRSLMLESELRKAIKQDQFEVYFQPIIDINNNRISVLEVLVRWEHPKLGLLLPHEFISLANEIELLTPLTKLILEKGLKKGKEWTKQGIKIAFNITAEQLLSEKFLETLLKVCLANQVPPSLVELEITEEQTLENNPDVIHIIQCIKKYGYQFVLDDFGVGYSSLQYLNNFPIDKIKIDRSFLLKSSEKQKNIIKAIIELCKKLGIKTVCEGVEDSHQYTFLMQANCDEIQGFFFSTPLQDSEVNDFIKSFSIDNSQTIRLEKISSLNDNNNILSAKNASI